MSKDREGKRREPMIETSELTGFLDDGTEFTGQMKFTGTMRIDGKYEGTIKSDSMLIVGESAHIKAEILEVGSISINGYVEGKIIAKEKIEVHSKGRVYGTVKTPSLVIDDGAILQGQCEMDQKGTEKKLESPKKQRD
jgi:cytoskeletal protein CcmA (bactofilin family)